MTPSHHSWPSWPPYFTPERPRDANERAVRTTMAVWASAVLLVALLVLVYLLWTIV
jgi:type VI protein secretion system component VasF